MTDIKMICTSCSSWRTSVQKLSLVNGSIKDWPFTKKIKYFLFTKRRHASLFNIGRGDINIFLVVVCNSNDFCILVYRLPKKLQIFTKNVQTWPKKSFASLVHSWQNFSSFSRVDFSKLQATLAQFGMSVRSDENCHFHGASNTF